MEIFTLLETLEDILERGKSVPFTTKTIIDKEELLEVVKEIRLKLPDELKQAKWIKEERQSKEAENRIISMIDEHEITRKAYEQKNEIIETANEMSREITNGTKEYADGLLNNTEKVLADTLANLEKNISEAMNLMQISLEDTIKTVQNSRRELK